MKFMKKVTFAILAHVDAGKTTLSEAMLFHAGVIKKMGRVDKEDSFLDYDIKEKEVLLFFQKRSHLCIEKVK